jgi:Protein of unknown function (DUF998)
MTQTIGAPGVEQAARTDATTQKATSTLLGCGVVAGPWFLLVSFGQVLTRDGFDLRRHPLSALSLGDLGWLQVTNFVVTGLLVLAFAVGLRARLRGGRAGTWGPLLLGAHGLGLVAAGVFTADPALGFPPGAPAGVPSAYSWHATLHGVAFAGGMLALTAACFVFARRFAASRRRAWAGYCAATGVAALLLGAPVPVYAPSVRFALAAVVTFAWIMAIAARLRTPWP